MYSIACAIYVHVCTERIVHLNLCLLSLVQYISLCARTCACEPARSGVWVYMCDTCACVGMCDTCVCVMRAHMRLHVCTRVCMCVRAVRAFLTIIINERTHQTHGIVQTNQRILVIFYNFRNSYI